MASWSEPKKEETTAGSLMTGEPIPSLASIMQEQEREQKGAKRRKTPNKSVQKVQSGWNPSQNQQRITSLSSIMNEQRTNPPSPQRFTFVPQNSGARTKLTDEQCSTTASNSSDRQMASASGTKVVNVRKQSLRTLGYKDLVDWLQNPDHVYIGRNMTHYVPGAVGSKWGNPFKMTKGMTRESCCEQYKQYIKSDKKIQANGKTLLQSLNELKGKTLGCWCHPEMCHGHMLVQLIEEHC